MKNYILKVLAVCMALGLCSCGSQQTESENSQPVENNNNDNNYVTTADEPEETAVSSTESDGTGTYDITAAQVSADNILECSYYNKPDKINGYEYYVAGAYQGKVLVELCYDGIENDNGTSELGIYDFKSKNFTGLTQHENRYYLTCHNERYFIYTGFGKLFCYDRETNETFDIFNTPDNMDRTNEVPVILNNNVYFDAYRYDDDNSITPVLYEYSFDTKELSVMTENMQKPMSNGNDLLAFTPNEETGVYDTVIGLMNQGTENFVNTEPLNDITCTGNKIHGLLIYDDNHCSLKELRSGTEYLKTSPESGDTITNLWAEESFVSWFDVTGNLNTPCVLDIASETIITFDKLDPCYYTAYTDKNSGVIVSSQSENGYDICVFNSK